MRLAIDYQTDKPNNNIPISHLPFHRYFLFWGFLFWRNFLQKLLFSRIINDCLCRFCFQYCHVFQKSNDCLSVQLKTQIKAQVILCDSFRLRWIGIQIGCVWVFCIFLCVNWSVCVCMHACAKLNTFSFDTSFNSQRNLCVKTIQICLLSFKKEKEIREGEGRLE